MDEGWTISKRNMIIPTQLHNNPEW